MVMIEFIGTCVAVYFVFRFLDYLLRPKQKNATLREGDFLKEINGQLYVVREVEQAEPDALPRQMPDNVVAFNRRG